MLDPNVADGPMQLSNVTHVKFCGVNAPSLQDSSGTFGLNPYEQVGVQWLPLNMIPPCAQLPLLAAFVLSLWATQGSAMLHAKLEGKRPSKHGRCSISEA